jgi:hypothetical protein
VASDAAGGVGGVEEDAQALSIAVPRDGRADVRPVAARPYSDAAGVTLTTWLRSLANLPAVPTVKHPEQEEETEGGVFVTVLGDAPLDFRVRACNNRRGVRSGRRTGGRLADSQAHRSRAGGYEEYAHDSEDHSDAEKPHLLAS